MKILRLTECPVAAQAQALAEFEGHFTYPLGSQDSFSISHGPDYTAFFRSMGQASIYVAERGGEIAGVLGVVRRRVVLPGGERVAAAYFGDVKVAPAFRGGPALARLAGRACADLIADGLGAAYAVVMAGSPTPDRYTGRLGLPAFRRLGRVGIWRFATGEAEDAGAEPVLPNHRTAPSVRIEGGEPWRGSLVPPRRLRVGGAEACLLDTRRGKRLWRRDGAELLSAHLSDLRGGSPEERRALLQLARKEAAAAGFPGLFVAFPEAPGSAPAGGALRSEAWVYGTGLPEGLWEVNTAEI